ncbi:DUF4286 family protein [Hoeflea ulvae]|uniref:Uncharacterized protein n=1 Tax=Hoeflea ulvae TaxID=2983764 RepID=A0ABT3YC09_9HYPH|nr:DUF4286 family protein [Hoeflea ulvae]MCY0093428.1 hypothetical protein [Hoeflea ulvae]
MPLIGAGINAIWNDIAPEMRDEFFEWHPREHMQERMGIPGFRRGRRYIAVGEGVEFLTLYETETPETLVSKAYFDRLSEPTEWSLKVLPFFRNNMRGICRVRFSEGYADGGNLLALRYAADPEDTPDLSPLLSPLLSLPGVVGSHEFLCDPVLSSGNTSLQRGRMIGLPDRIILVEGSSIAALEPVLETLVNGGGLATFIDPQDMQSAFYTLEYQVLASTEN